MLAEVGSALPGNSAEGWWAEFQVIHPGDGWCRILLLWGLAMFQPSEAGPEPEQELAQSPVYGCDLPDHPSYRGSLPFLPREPA